MTAWVSRASANTVESDEISTERSVGDIPCFLALGVGTRVLEALRPAGRKARYQQEATLSALESVPTPERGNEPPLIDAPLDCGRQPQQGSPP